MNTTDLAPIPADADADRLHAQASALVDAWRAADANARERVAKSHPQPPANFTIDDAQLVLAREYGFETFAKLVQHVGELAKPGSKTRRFEAAADAIVDGDLDSLHVLLRDDPSLVHARSERVHEAMLLHYAGANGFENYRQKTPSNAVAIAIALLDAGADVNATAKMYGIATTLGLVATSIHPAKAGVQIALIDLLLDRGASIEGVSSSAQSASARSGEWPPLISALHNHRVEAAERLAERGARIDHLIPAAALGRLDLVERHLDERGRVRPEIAANVGWGIPADPDAQLAQAFVFACAFGRLDVVRYFLGKGVDPAITDAAGMTGLHWAAATGRHELIDLLVAHGAPLEAKNSYGGTVLDQTLWFAHNADSSSAVDYPAVARQLLAAGARDDVYPEMRAAIARLLDAPRGA